MISACNSKKNEYDPYKINGKEKKVDSKSSFEVSFKKTDANLKTIHVKLNNNGYDALFDTGCSGMLISSLELMELIKTNTISRNYVALLCIDSLQSRATFCAGARYPLFNFAKMRV